MAQQQLLLLILGAIIIGVSIYVGILIFASSNTTLNQSDIIADLQQLGTDAYSFSYRPIVMGGGGGSFERYSIAPTGPWGSENTNAVYAIAAQSATEITFTATSKVVAGGAVAITFDRFGKVVSGPTASGF